MNGSGQTRWPIFGRDVELAEIGKRLSERKSFLLHGAPGLGKSLLLRNALPNFPQALYCKDTKSPQAVFRSLADSLISVGDATTKALLKRAPASSKTAVSLKGIVLDSLRTSPRTIVLDQLVRPSQALGTAVKELKHAGATIASVARSAHMEDAGYILPLYPFREERFELLPFDSRLAAEFAMVVANNLGITADNRQEFVDRVIEFGKGNPGIILALLRKGAQEKYRTGDRIKIVPLYIDFRLEWNAIA